MDAMNKACLLKWGWKLKLNVTDLWSNVLRGKYIRHGGIFERCKSTDSSLWKALVKLSPNLDKYSFWMGKQFQLGTKHG
jgi:hypothetical protein